MNKHKCEHKCGNKNKNNSNNNNNNNNDNKNKKQHKAIQTRQDNTSLHKRQQDQTIITKNKQR